LDLGRALELEAKRAKCRPWIGCLPPLEMGCLRPPAGCLPRPRYSGKLDSASSYPDDSLLHRPVALARGHHATAVLLSAFICVRLLPSPSCLVAPCTAHHLAGYLGCGTLHSPGPAIHFPLSTLHFAPCAIPPARCPDNQCLKSCSELLLCCPVQSLPSSRRRLDAVLPLSWLC
jgi:hypothetical protein